MWVFLALLVPSALACEMIPGDDAGPKSPGDNFYRLIINGEVERYAPEQRYVVTLVGSRTHNIVQQFTRFQIKADPLNPAEPRTPRKQGQFQLFADTLTKFDEECTNSVIEADDLPKTEVQVMWKAPPAGSGCVMLKALVFENASRWFAEDGQLSRRVCEDTARAAPDCCACDDARYKLVFSGLWSPQTHPKDFPTAALWLTHFSDVIGATHRKNASFWGEGQIATDGFRSLAEWGSVGLLERELRQRGGLRSVVKAGGLWHPRLNGNTSAAFTADRQRPYLSLASMFGPSPDWVVGVSGLNLCRPDCTWVEHEVVDLFPYDAGTDGGISYMSPNSETVPREKMYRITTMYPEDPRAPFYNPDKKEMNPMARLYLTREKLIPRACDEQTLQALVLEETENTESVNRPECATGAWSAWSECSVTCGKGLRMRTREYSAPAAARAAACDRQLVAKEMCAAAVPECEGDSANLAEPESETAGEGSPGEEGGPGGVCETSAWGEWSECSVTCGVGFRTRRRHFLNQMGFKKCPLVAIEDTNKCMEPACTEAELEGDVADPQCPTSAWSAWSPCSASCGRGVKFRTRLLLVPAANAADCAARVELMQQRACSERDDCALDMLTAKRICMEEPQQGPCRGVYRRWAFAAAKGMCVPFTYGGCRGSRNNFLSQEDCLATCSVILGGAAPGVLPGAGAQAPPVASSNYPGLSISSIVPALTGVQQAQSGECVLSGWSAWSACSVTCGGGYQERSRTVLKAAVAGAAPCPTRLTRRRRCSRAC